MNNMKDWYSYQEAAKEFGICQSSISKLFKQYPDIKEKYVKKYKFEGCRLRNNISKEGMIVIANVKNPFNGNQFVEKSEVSAHLPKAKQKLAEKAIEKSELSPAQALLQSVQIMVGLESKVKDLTEEVQKLRSGQDSARRNLLELPEPHIEAKEASSRSRVRQRVNTYSRAMGVDYSDIWNKLYNEIYYRHGINVSIQARNKNCSALDIIEEKELMEELWSIACSMLKIEE